MKVLDFRELVSLLISLLISLLVSLLVSLIVGLKITLLAKKPDLGWGLVGLRPKSGFSPQTPLI